jgi:opacity protein-like surface antigen
MGSFVSAQGFRIGLSLGYQFVTDSIYKNTYGTGFLTFGGFLSYDLPKNFELRGEIDFSKDTGETTLTKEEITFSTVPVRIGIRIKLAEITRLSPYLGAGIGVVFFKEKARIGDTSDSTFGYHLEGGCYVALGQRFRMDLNLRYVNADAKPFEETLKLGGFKLGIGGSYSF